MEWINAGITAIVFVLSREYPLSMLLREGPL